MADDLLKQAIADAKLVRETALANAKAALEEAFKPQIAEMLSAKLRENAITEDNDASSEIGGNGVTVKNPAAKEPSKAASDSSHIVNPGLEIEDIFDGPSGTPKTVKEAFPAAPTDDDDDAASAPVDASPAPAVAPAPTGVGAAPAPAAPVPSPAPAPVGGAPADPSGLDAGMGGEQGGDELDLEAIIRELEAEANGGSPDVSEPSLGEGFDDPMCGAKVDGPITVKEDAEGVFSDGKSPAAVDGVNGGKKVSPGQEVTGTKAETMTEGEVNEEINLEEILREMEAGDAAPVVEDAKIAAENVELKKALREHREVVQFLRSKLNEVNMLNAKLLYTNKLFKAANLTVEQKMKVVETFDRASNLREVKLIYSTLAESIATKSAKTPAAKANAKAITEGLASKPVASTKPKSAPAVLEEGDAAQRARLQKLAGIKIL